MANINYTAVDFKDRIGILEAVTTRDAERNVITTYREIATVWAHIETRNRTTQTQTGEKPFYVHQITIRYDKSLLPRIDAIRLNDQTQALTVPPLATGNKYITFETVEAYDYGPAR